MTDIKGYTTEIEDLFIQFLISDPELFVRCKGIISSDYFNNITNKKVIDFLLSYSDDQTALPQLVQIAAVAGKTIDPIIDVDGPHGDWFLKEFEVFSRHKALEIAILSSPDLLEEGRYGEVEVNIKKAVQIGLVKDLGTDYFKDPKERLERMRDNSSMISTGWRDVDHALYGGFNRGEITIFCGQSGAGKSLFLQNLSINWATAGMNVVYITLELNESLCAMRLDAMVSGYATTEVIRNIDDVSMRVRSYQMKYKGNLQLKYMPSGSTSNEIRSYIKEYQIQNGLIVGAILVDYLDLVHPVNKKVSPSDLFVKDKYVSEELRSLAVELDVLMVSASQLNRGSYEEIEFDPSHIAGGISKVNTADNVIGIFTTMAMREAGRYQIQFMKTRSSAGVGSKVDLMFDRKTLRILDMDEDAVDAITAQTSNIMDTLKKKSIVTSKVVPEDANKQTNVASKATALRHLVNRME